MPELPEVQTIVNDLSAVLPGRLLRDIKVIWPGSLNVSRQLLLKRISQTPVLEVRRLGKSAVIDFGPWLLHIHLKMTGQLVWRSQSDFFAGGHPIVGVGKELPNKFTRLIFSFDNGQLFFNDVRKFGWIKLLQAAELVEYHSGLGLEPMQSSFSYNNFRKAMRLSRRPIKAALLDQSAIVGLGNIYVDESLFEAGILPQRPVDSLSELEWQSLHKAIKKILKLAIKHRGTSFSDYRDAQGQRGNFADRLRVYGRGGQACLRCGAILLKERLAGRGTHWCPNCQH